MLWVSNGGRDFSPVERAAHRRSGHRGWLRGGGVGLRAAQGDNRIKAFGVPTTIPLGDRHVIPHAILSLPRPPGWSEVTTITLHDDTLTLRDITGGEIAVPFPEEHFA
jgi:hypothetical protein